MAFVVSRAKIFFLARYRLCQIPSVRNNWGFPNRNARRFHLAKSKQKNRTRTKRNKRKAGYRARCGDGVLQSWTVGPLPIVNQLLHRMRLEDILRDHLPPDNSRTKVPTVRCLLLLVRNILLSREPIYGLEEWAERYAPDLLGLTQQQLGQLNDDRVGRCLP